MWLLTKNLNDQDEVFCVFGKSLFLAQKFEGTCNDIVKWLHISEILVEKRMEFDTDEYVNYCEKLSKAFLGTTINSINDIKKTANITDEDIQILVEGKDSRNWIVHELCFESIVENYNQRGVNYTYPPELKDHLIKLLNAEYLVSKWSYEFYEKEFGNFFSKGKYIDEILKWIGV